MFDAAGKIHEALGALSESEIKKAMLMALVAIGKPDLLLDPEGIAFASVVACESPAVADSLANLAEQEKQKALH